MTRMRLTVGLVLLFLVAVAGDLSAQVTGSIRGRVVADNGQPIAGAQVSMPGLQLGTLTNSQGQFLLPRVPAGTHTLEARQLGYGTVSEQVVVAGGEGVVQNFRLVQEAVAIEQVTVTVGSRANRTAADELAVPVDVYTEAAIQETNRLEMAEVLQELSPSVNFPRPQIADITSGVRPFQLRGLSPDHALVLLNGKRRHPTAVVHVFGATSMTSGSSGVDMNAIPSLALGQMDILRDGAAAQYGSDAIAGVINLNLKNTVTAPSISATYGVHNPGAPFPDIDGQRWNVAGNVGLPIFAGGTLNLTGEISDRNITNRACPDPRDQIVSGDADVVVDCVVTQKNNAVAQPNHLDGDGEFRNYMLFWNAQLPLAEIALDRELYFFGGYSMREDKHSGYFRRSLDNRNWPTIHPLGFLPKFRADTRDLSVVGGLRGIAGSWNYDISAQMGQNRLENDIYNSLNVSLGPCLDTPCAPGADGVLGTADDPGIPNSTDMFAGALQLTQYSADIDISRQLPIGLAEPLNLAFGATYRSENYVIEEGELASYVNGYYPNRSGGTAAIGAQVFQGYLPRQAVDASRDNAGVYADIEASLTDNFLLATAARFENYSDFGSTLTGKLAARYQPVERFILRAAVSTGFRAPALSQQYYAHTSTGFQDDPNNPGNQIAYEIGEFPVGSPEAIALGAKPLDEEKSRNFSAGFAATPVDGFNLTADLYRIYVNDRILLSNTLRIDDSPQGQVVADLLSDFNVRGVKYFLNAFDTETTGVDVTANYRYLFNQDRFLETVLSYNWNQQKLKGDVATPDVISGFGATLFPATSRVAIEKGRPAQRVNGRVRYTQGAVSGQIGANYFGKLTTLFEDPDRLYVYGSKFIVDADLGFELPGGIDLTLGVENLFNQFPDLTPDGENFLGIFHFANNGAGPNGRYLYTQLRWAM